MEDGCSEECLVSGNVGACQPSMSSSASLSLQLQSIMFLAATVNESRAASVESGVGTTRAVRHFAISRCKAGQRVEPIERNVGWVVLGYSF